MTQKIGKATHHNHIRHSTKKMSKISSIKWNGKWNQAILVVLLIIIAIGFSTYFRMYPSSLPITHQWAQDSVYNQIRTSVAGQVAQQYPNLPTAQRKDFIENKLQTYVTTNADQINPQIEKLSTLFKDKLQDENGQTYLLAIDPYLAYSYAKNYEANGNPGTTITDEKPNMALRGGREPRFETTRPHARAMDIFYKILHFFNKNINLQRAIFLYPVFIIALAIIPAFFIGRKIAGNLAGFIAGMIIALNSALLGRTPAGFADTDGYIILFPLVIMLLFIYALTAKKTSNKIWLGLGLGAVQAIFVTGYWNNGWHTGTIMLAVMGIYFIYTLIKDIKKIKHLNIQQTLWNTTAGKTILLGLSFMISVFITAGIIAAKNGVAFLTKGWVTTIQMITGPLAGLGVKNVATTSIWPNVLTTVAELNAGTWGQIVSSVGGKLFLTIGIIGILLTFFMKTEDNKIEIRYASILTIWFGVLVVASLISSRFIALLAAPFAIAFGAAFGLIWKLSKQYLKGDRKTTGIVIRVATLLVIGILFITPITQANNVALNEVPSMNDGWHNSLITIKENTSDGIITSWWDFGHWFVNVAERRVTFDGGDQGNRIYWVGKLLATDNLTENKAILRMLNCGQNVGYDRILNATKDDYLSTKLINKIIYESPEDARTQLEQAGLTSEQIRGVLEKTHCSDNDLLDQYVIVSEDMTGKAGVWAHFGNWNFDKAYAYNIARNNDYDTSVHLLEEKLGYDEEQAAQTYFDATALTNSREVDSWISPWPSYVTTSAKDCVEDNTTITCTINQVIQQNQGVQVSMYQAIIPKEDPTKTIITVQTNSNGRIELSPDTFKPARVTIGNETEYKKYPIKKSDFNIGLTVAKTKTGYKLVAADPLIDDSSYSKLFFLEGVGMSGYTKLSDVRTFNGQRIIIYKVDLTGLAASQ